MTLGRPVPRIARLTAILMVSMSCRAAPQPYNLLLVTIDTLRPDRLGFAGHDRDLSEAMDRLAEEGVVFERFYSQGGWTLPSIASILTGRYPCEHGATTTDRLLQPELPTMAQLLASEGYDTHAFVSHVFLNADYGLDKGFATYDDSVLQVGRPHKVTTAEPLTDLAIERLASTRRPFFLWIHYFDPHFEYIRHADWSFGRRKIDRYDGEIANTDRHLGRLMEALHERDLYEGTVIVLTGDHGEEFGEHGGRYHYGIDEVDIRIPLLIRAPGLEPGVVTTVGQQIDLLPTVLDLLEIAVDEGLPGQSLVDDSRRSRPVFVERIQPRPFHQRALIVGNRKLAVVEIDDGFTGDLGRRLAVTGIRPGYRLFDLDLDPGETTDLWGEGGPHADRLLEALESYSSLTVSPSLVLDRDDEFTRKLQSLGYLQ